MSNWRDLLYDERPIYPETLAEQEAALAADEQLADFRALREKYEGARYRPIYHFLRPDGYLNDPNGLCFWEGRWHMFYQACDSKLHWGHAVSDDLVRWRDLPLAIYPKFDEACFSGGTCIDEENHRVIAAHYGYTGYGEGGWRCGVCVATSSDPLLLNWTKVNDGKAVIPDADAPCWAPPDAPPVPGQKPYKVFDANIWKENGVYYILTAGYDVHPVTKRRFRQIYLLKCEDDDLIHWEYVKPFLENDTFRELGDDGACPYFIPIGDGKRLLAHFSHRAVAKWLAGDYDPSTQTFEPFAAGRFTSGYQMMVAPSAFPCGDGEAALIFNMNDWLAHDGWCGIMTLPRRVSLGGVWGDELMQKPFADLSSLHDKHTGFASLTLTHGERTTLDGAGGDAFELDIDVKADQIPSTLEIELLRSPDGAETTKVTFYRRAGGMYAILPYATDSVIQLDVSSSSLDPSFKKHPPEIASVVAENSDDLHIRIFVDKSVVEVFVNDRAAVAARAYPTRGDSRQIALTAYGEGGQNAVIEKIDFFTMKSIW